MKRIERITLDQRTVLGEIRRGAKDIAADLHPDSPLMKKVRGDREQADRRLANSGIIVIL